MINLQTLKDLTVISVIFANLIKKATKKLTLED
jgi:hypothetical protein